MFEGQPKGLYALALANTGERFGYYTMLAIFVLFLQAQYGYTVAEAGQIYGGFLAFTYFCPLVGGFLADRFGYGKMVTLGIFVMFLGYLLLAAPMGGSAAGKAMIFGALALIAVGTGLFKGNLQVMVGNLYDAPQLQGKRDSAFSLFYMAINIGALFAPTAATKVTNYVLGANGFTYNPRIPELAHQYLDRPQGMTPEAYRLLEEAMGEQGFVGDLTAFCTTYIDRLSEAYHYGFGVACLSLVVSVAIYYAFRSSFKHADYNAKTAPAQVQAEVLTPAETRARVVALLLVFAVVIFFWMSFHQNGLTMTTFAQNYTQGRADGLNVMSFDVLNLVLIVLCVYGAFGIVQNGGGKGRLIAWVMTAVGVAGLAAQYATKPAEIEVQPQMFQQFNPFFVVALTPFSLAIFSYLGKRGKEPSAPRKIGLGMLVAALGFCILTAVSFGMPSPAALKEGATATLVSPNWLISTYLVLTFAELLLSPMGISFVSKVAPPKLKGTMMGGWFAATAIGNYLTSVPALLWDKVELWMVWAVLIVLCLLSALFIFSLMKRLEKVA